MTLRLPRLAPALAALLIGSVAALPSLAQEASTRPSTKAPSLSAEQVLDRAQAAIGGADLAKQKNRVQKGRFTMAAVGISGSLTVYTAPPNLFLNVIELGALGTTTQGYDGKTAWANDAMQGPRIMSGDELEGLLLQATFDGKLKDMFTEAELVATEDFEGRPSYKLALTLASGMAATAWFDVETALMNGMEMKTATAMGEIPVTLVMSDYAEMGGMKVAKRTVSKIAGMEQIIMIDEVLVDVENLPSFAPPPEIAALVKDKP